MQIRRRKPRDRTRKTKRRYLGGNEAAVSRRTWKEFGRQHVAKIALGAVAATAVAGYLGANHMIKLNEQRNTNNTANSVKDLNEYAKNQQRLHEDNIKQQQKLTRANKHRNTMEAQALAKSLKKTRKLELKQQKRKSDEISGIKKQQDLRRAKRFAERIAYVQTHPEEVAEEKLKYLQKEDNFIGISRHAAKKINNLQELLIPKPGQKHPTLDAQRNYALEKRKIEEEKNIKLKLQELYYDNRELKQMGIYKEDPAGNYVKKTKLNMEIANHNDKKLAKFIDKTSIYPGFDDNINYNISSFIY